MKRLLTIFLILAGIGVGIWISEGTGDADAVNEQKSTSAQEATGLSPIGACYNFLRPNFSDVPVKYDVHESSVEKVENNFVVFAVMRVGAEGQRTRREFKCEIKDAEHDWRLIKLTEGISEKLSASGLIW